MCDKIQERRNWGGTSSMQIKVISRCAVWAGEGGGADWRYSWESGKLFAGEAEQMRKGRRWVYLNSGEFNNVGYPNRILGVVLSVCMWSHSGREEAQRQTSRFGNGKESWNGYPTGAPAASGRQDSSVLWGHPLAYIGHTEVEEDTPMHWAIEYGNLPFAPTCPTHIPLNRTFLLTCPNLF